VKSFSLAGWFSSRHAIKLASAPGLPSREFAAEFVIEDF
jgi:hypothetical protein